MQKFKFIPLLLLLQACVSTQSGHYDTKSSSSLDGAWIETKCICAEKDVWAPDLQYASVMIINGNKLFQEQIARWKNPEWVKYCSIHRESSIRPTSDSIFEVTTTTERNFSSGDAKCDTINDSSRRTWKMLKVDQSELKYESSAGCASGPLTCAFKRLDQ